MGYPAILYDSILEGAILSATDTDSDSEYDVDFLADLRNYTWWQAASAGEKTITIDCGRPVWADAIGLIGHNLAFSPVVKIQYSDDNFSSDINTALDWGTGSLGTALIGQWLFDEDSGTTVYDSSENGNDGTLTGTAPALVDGLKSFGNAVYFPGTDEYITIANASPISSLGNGSFWFSLWMQSGENIKTYGRVLEKYQDSSNYFYVSNNVLLNQVRISIIKGGTSATGAFSSATPFDQQINHIVIVVDRTLDIAYCYVNGVRSSAGEDLNLSSLPADCSNTGALTFGAVTGGTNCYQGILDDCRVYTGVPTLAEVTAIYEGTEAPQNNNAFAQTFAAAFARYWRIVAANHVEAPKMACPVLGSRLTFPEYLDSPFDPFQESIESDIATSKAGHLLSVTTRFYPFQALPKFSDISRSWVLTTYQTFWRVHGRLLKPFFWFPDLENDPDIVLWSRFQQRARFQLPSEYGTEVNLSLQIEGIIE